MTIKEVIKQLESLYSNSESYIDSLDPGSEWHKDLWALAFAIELIKKTYPAGTEKGRENTTTNNYNKNNQICKLKGEKYEL